MSFNFSKQEPSTYVFGVSKGNENAVKGHETRTADLECGYMLPTFKQMIQTDPQLRLLDVGCGPGTITASLAELMPDGEVIGTDLSLPVIEKAQRHAETLKLSNLKFVQGDAYDLPFEDGSFDVVHAHQILVHLTEPLKALKQLLRVTKKGGILCLRETDLPTVRFYPQDPMLYASWTASWNLVEKNGGDPETGLKLRPWLASLGVPRENITATAGTWCYSSVEARVGWGQRWAGLLRGGTLAESAVEKGVATREQLEEFAAAWERWTQDPDGMYCLMHGQCVVRV